MPTARGEREFDLVERLDLLPLPVVELGHELLELARVLEVAVDGGVADVGDPIEGAKRAHDELADPVTLHLDTGMPRQGVFDGFDHGVHRHRGHGALGTRDLDRPEQLVAVELLGGAVPLEDLDRSLLDVLVRREARLADEALPTTPNGTAEDTVMTYEADLLQLLSVIATDSSNVVIESPQDLIGQKTINFFHHPADREKMWELLRRDG